jgi:hypothetical protein
MAISIRDTRPLKADLSGLVLLEGVWELTEAVSQYQSLRPERRASVESESQLVVKEKLIRSGN